MRKKSPQNSLQQGLDDLLAVIHTAHMLGKKFPKGLEPSRVLPNLTGRDTKWVVETAMGDLALDLFQKLMEEHSTATPSYRSYLGIQLYQRFSRPLSFPAELGDIVGCIPNGVLFNPDLKEVLWFMERLQLMHQISRKLPSLQSPLTNHLGWRRPIGDDAFALKDAMTHLCTRFPTWDAILTEMQGKPSDRQPETNGHISGLCLGFNALEPITA